MYCTYLTEGVGVPVATQGRTMVPPMGTVTEWRLSKITGRAISPGSVGARWGKLGQVGGEVR